MNAFARSYSRIGHVAAAIGAMLGFYRGPLAASTAVAHVPAPTPKAKPRAARNAPRKARWGTLWGSTGRPRTQFQEMARRCRQIARGQLTASNGLALGSAGFKVNSHGRVSFAEGFTPESLRGAPLRQETRRYA